MATSNAIRQDELQGIINEMAHIVKNGATLAELEREVAKEWSGDGFRFHRQAVMLEITGQRLGVAACGIKAVAKRIFEKYAPTEGVTAEKAADAITDAIVTQEVVAPVKSAAKKPKAEKVEKVEAATTTDEVVIPKASKGIKNFDRPTDIAGVKIKYRADLTERMAAIETPQAFEKFFAGLPESCGLVSRLVPYFTREWTFRIVSADEKTKFSLNKVIKKFEVHLNGKKQEDMTTDFRALDNITAVMNTTKLKGVTITDGKKILSFDEGTKYGIELMCQVTSRTRLKTLATDFAIVERI